LQSVDSAQSTTGVLNIARGWTWTDPISCGSIPLDQSPLEARRCVGRTWRGPRLL